MKKIVITSGLILVLAATLLLLEPIRGVIFEKQPGQTAAATDATEPLQEPTDPNAYDADDMDFAKKKLIQHQLAVLIADKAKTDAIDPAVREHASTVSRTETERANVYAKLLTSWNEPYMNITDYPEKDGCNGYPTFPGMLPHIEVGNYRLSSGVSVDQVYFDLLIEHHERAKELEEFEGARVSYGELIRLMKASTAEYDQEAVNLRAFKSTLL